MKTILCCLLFLVFIPTISYSLSDKEYNKLLSSSPEFKKYDAELNKLWKIVISKVPASMKKDLLNDQRFFVNKGREIDSSNVQYINLNRSNNDIPKIDRYILSTKKRIEELKMFLKFLENGSVMIEGKAQNIHDEAGGGYGVCRYVQEKDKDLAVCFIIGYYYELENKDFNSYLSNAADNSEIIKVRGRLEDPSSFDPNTVTIVY